MKDLIKLSVNMNKIIKKYETCYELASLKIRDTKIFKRKIKVRSLRAVGWRNKRQFKKSYLISKDKKGVTESLIRTLKEDSQIHCSSRNISIDEMKVFSIRKSVKKGRNCGNL